MLDNKKQRSRPRSHTIEDEQRIRFEALLQKHGWVYRRLDLPDYGIDGQVEIFDQGNRTGLSFYVQLRATDQKNDARAQKIFVSPKELDYYLSKTEPVMVVRYASHTQTMYWQWATRLTRKGAWSKKALSAFSFLNPQLWNDSSADVITSDLKAERVIAQGNIGLPINISVLFHTEPYTFSSTLIKTELLRLAALMGPICKLDFLGRDSAVSVHISGDFIHIAAGVNRSYTVECSFYESPTARTLAADIYCLLGLLLERSGESSAGAVFIAQAIGDSKIVSIEYFAHRLAAAMVSTGNLDKARIALECYAHCVDDFNKLSFIVKSLPAGMLPKSKDDAEIALSICRSLIEIALVRHGARAAGVLTYNMADSLPGVFSSEALQLLAEAGELDPTYKARDYYWRHQAMRQLDVDNIESAIQSALVAVKIKDSVENRIAAVKCFAAAGRFCDASATFQNCEITTDIDKAGLLHGRCSLILCALNVSVSFKSIRETVLYLENLVDSTDDSTDPMATYASLLLIFVLDLRIDALLSCIVAFGDQDSLSLIEVAIEYGLEQLGSEFIVYAKECLEVMNLPNEALDAILEAFHLKLIEVENIKKPFEVRVLLENGEYDSVDLTDFGM